MSVKARLRPYVMAARRFRSGDLRLADLAWGRGTTFSQFGEDAVIATLFGNQDRGFYVDVGAYHPFNASNTYNLYRRGWRGINLEPDPGAFPAFERYRPGDINLPLAVSDVAGEVPFTLAGSFSGIDQAGFLGGVETKVPAVPLADILDEHLPAGQTIDLLDVDCEGHDLTVLRSNDWVRYRPRVVLAEWHDDDAPARFLVDQGYTQCVRLAVTGVFVAA